MLRDQHRLRQQLQRLKSETKKAKPKPSQPAAKPIKIGNSLTAKTPASPAPPATDPRLQPLADRLDASIQLRQKRTDAFPKVAVDETLPIF